MKNIHVLQTDKRSRLWTNNLRRRLELDEFPEQHPTNIAKHIYITSDEEIKEGNWVFNETSKEVYKITNVDELVIYEKKIILTTDPDLIKDGVQAIDDEFLEWFVKNPSCESVDVIYDKDTFPYGVETAKGYGWYKIIIPQEEPKQKVICTNDICQGECVECNFMTIVNVEEPKEELELKDFETGDILDVLNMGNVEYLSNGDIIYNPNLFFVKRGDKWFIKTK
jgi:hypothetical protein